MKRKVFTFLMVLVAASLTVRTSAGAEEGVDGQGASSAGIHDGMYIGTGKILGEVGADVYCGVFEVPIMFYVRDGKAKSVFDDKRLSFETEIRKKGRIRFAYEDIGQGNRGGGWIESTSIFFSGKLKGSEGKGSMDFAQCGGRWEVTRHEPVTARGVEFYIYNDRLLMMEEGELARVLGPREGSRFTGTSASGDFLAIHVDDPEDGSTLLFRFEDPQNVKYLGTVPKHLKFSEALALDEARGVDVSLKDGRLCLYEGDSLVDSVGPAPSRTIQRFCACGDFIAVHESDEQGNITTVVYYLRDDNSFAIAAQLEGKPYSFQ